MSGSALFPSLSDAMRGPRRSIVKHLRSRKRRKGRATTHTRRVERFERSVLVARPPLVVFDFCCRGENLVQIFPGRLTATRKTRETVARPGGEYSFRYWIRSFIPTRWDVRIERFDEGREFVDVQVRGPFRVWRHLHTFEPVEGGTECADVVEYATFLGKRLDRTLVRAEIARVFVHRHRELKRILESTSSSSAGG
jgi:ligand-binding SRPBCC domain-containing protein